VCDVRPVVGARRHEQFFVKRFDRPSRQLQQATCLAPEIDMTMIQRRLLQCQRFFGSQGQCAFWWSFGIDRYLVSHMPDLSGF
jgi:hypothetical protein